MKRQRRTAHHRYLLGLSMFLAGAAAAGAANAESMGPGYWLYDRNAAAPFARGQFFLSIDMRGGVQQLPRFNTTYFSGPAALGPVTHVGVSSEDDVKFVQPGGTIGFAFRDGTLPPWMGQRVRIALSGSYVGGSLERDLTSTRPAIQTIQVAMIGGTTSPVAFCTGCTLFTENLKVEREGFDLALRVASDFAMSPNLSLTPSVGVIGGHTTHSYRYFASFSGFSPTLVAGPYNLDETLRTREVGADFGLAATWQFAPGFALNVGGSAAVVWSHTSLSGNDCVNLTNTPPGACGPSNALLFTSSVSDSRSTVGFRGTLNLALSADLRYAVLTVGGFARYDSRIPGVANPQITATTAAVQTTGPARIFYDSGFAYGGMLSLRVPLGL